jgi:hypothetical protein
MRPGLRAVSGHRPGRQVERIAFPEPGVPVRRKDAEGATALGQQLVALEDQVVLAQVQRDAGIGQRAAYPRIAGQGCGFVVVVGKDRLHAQPGGQRDDLVAGPPVAHDQAHAFHAVRGGQCTQFGIQADQAVADELHTPVGPGQGFQDRAVEDKSAPHLPRCPQRMMQGRMVVGAQVAAQPDEGAGKRSWVSRPVVWGQNRILPMASASRIDLTNQFLIAMPGMADETFAGTVVYLCEHTDKGALGSGDQQAHRHQAASNLFEKVELDAAPDRTGRAAGVFRRPGADRTRVRAARASWPKTRPATTRR